jgi:MYXO-CTERM domain-containing protein
MSRWTLGLVMWVVEASAGTHTADTFLPVDTADTAAADTAAASDTADTANTGIGWIETDTDLEDTDLVDTDDDTDGLVDTFMPVTTPTYGAATLAGETGGMSCATTGGPGGLLVSALLLAAGRRRRAGPGLTAGRTAPVP